GKGANGVFSTGASAVCYMTNDTILCDSTGSHGVDATVAAKMILKNVVITTHGNSASAAISTDKGGGTILCTLVTANSTGTGSPAIYSTGTITAVNCVLNGPGSEGGVIEGANSITLVNSTMSGGLKGCLLYQSMSGDAAGVKPEFSITGGSFTASAGPLFYTTNANSQITAKGATLSAMSDTFMRADSNKWGTPGSNGGTATFTADSQSFSGYIVADAYSNINLAMKNSSGYTGAINPSNKAKSIKLTMDATSSWGLTADSYIDTMSDAGISGTTASNITGNNHNVYYTSAASSSLGGKTYTLTNGGCLLPVGGTCTNTTMIENESVRSLSASSLSSIMTATGHVAFSPLYSDKTKIVGLYNLAGKQLSVKTFKKNEVNVRADFGASDGAYIIKILGIK
ncbi:MAG TPA: hypothetical protein DCO75_08810, partial [Fibrobacteres bacterium]|nr:hypothetical protein [Fibrobacterota bacterium]